MRIALHHSRYGPLGGSEGYVRVLVDRLLDLGHRVEIFAARVEAPPHRAGLELHRLPGAAFPHWRRVRAFAAAQAAAAADPAFDLVVGFGRTAAQDLYRDGSGPQRDYLEWLDAGLPAWRRRLRDWRPTRRATLAVERARFADPGLLRIQAVSAQTRDALVGRYPALADRIRVVHTGVDTRRFSPERRLEIRKTAFRKLGLEPGPPTFLFLGNDWRRKGLLLLLRGLASLPGEWRLLVAGADGRPGRYRRAARDLGVAGRIRWLGPAEAPEECYAVADALLFPSRFDTFPNVPLEAMAMGLAVAAGDTIGTAEVLTGAAASMRVADDGEAGSWTRAAAELLVPATREGRGAAALELVRRELTWERHLERLLPLYEETAALKRARRA